MTEKPQWKKKKIGEDELAELWRETARPENTEQLLALVSEIQGEPFWPQIEALAERCDEILQKEGFPRGVVGYLVAQEGSECFSDAWYAARIGFDCFKALDQFRGGNSGTPYLYSLVFGIGKQVADWNWRNAHKPSIVTGQKQRQTLGDHRAKAHTRQRKAMSARRAVIETLLRKMPDSRTGSKREKYLHKELSKRGIKVSLRTVRRDLRELRRSSYPLYERMKKLGQRG